MEKPYFTTLDHKIVFCSMEAIYDIQNRLYALEKLCHCLWQSGEDVSLENMQWGVMAIADSISALHEDIEEMETPNGICKC